MILHEKFDLDNSSAPYFSSQIDFLICGYRDVSTPDDRANHVKSLIIHSGDTYYFNTDENANSLSYYIIDKDNNTIDQQDGLNLIPDLRKMLIENNAQQANICIDITYLKQPILFLLIKLLTSEIKPKKLFAAYTAPKEYKKINHINPGEEEYELYDRIVGCNYSLPGFAKINRNDNELLVASFGFERQRLLSLYENVEPKGGLIPILSFPPVVPGWNLTALHMNYKVLSDAGSEGRIMHCDAACPFELYNILNEIHKTYADEYEILLAPLGTRPHSLGCALYASLNPYQCHLIYDFPIEKTFRSNGVMKSYMYHLSNYIK